eukprot:31178-Pelagococcus_subviridis.AAC.3
MSGNPTSVAFAFAFAAPGVATSAGPILRSGGGSSAGCRSCDTRCNTPSTHRITRARNSGSTTGPVGRGCDVSATSCLTAGANGSPNGSGDRGCGAATVACATALTPDAIPGGVSASASACGPATADNVRHAHSSAAAGAAPKSPRPGIAAKSCIVDSKSACLVPISTSASARRGATPGEDATAARAASSASRAPLASPPLARADSGCVAFPAPSLLALVIALAISGRLFRNGSTLAYINSLCVRPGAGKISGRYSSAHELVSVNTPGSISSSCIVCMALYPSIPGSASCGWYSKPSPVLDTASEYECSRRCTAYTSAWPPCFVHQPPGRRRHRPRGMLRTRSITNSSQCRKRELSALPAGHDSARSPRLTKFCLASFSALCSGAVVGMTIAPSARPTSVDDCTSGRSAPSGDDAASAARRRSTASFVSIASARRSTNAGVSHAAPGTGGIAGPPSGPHKPARSNAPVNRFFFPEISNSPSPPFFPLFPSPPFPLPSPSPPSPPATTPAASTPGPPAATPAAAFCRVSAMHSESAVTHACNCRGGVERRQLALKGVEDGD